MVNRKINEADNGGWDVVYKEYSANVLPQLDTAALEAAVALVGEPGFTEGKWLCEKTAWPAATVLRQGRACGFLMRAVPDRFYFTLRSLTGTTPGTRRLANLEYLLNDDSYVAGIGLAISDRERLALLADLATTLTKLHRMGISVGDLSPKNLLFTTAPRPECFLIDCDAARLRGATVLPQAETPDWQLIAGEEKATRPGDVYKFTLLAIRLFARDQTCTDPAVLAGISPILANMAREGLNRDPAFRPAPSQWAEQLAATVRTASKAPTVASPAHTAGQRPLARPPTPAGIGPRPGRLPGHAAGSATIPGGIRVSGKAAGAIAAVVLAAILAIAAPHMHDADSSDTGVTPRPQVLVDPTHPTDPDTPTQETTTKPAQDTTDDNTPAPAPTTALPLPALPAPPPLLPPPPLPPPPPPRPNYYGAIAVSQDGSIGKSWDYKSASAAQEGALSRCRGTGCKVLTTFVNSCGAVAYNSNSRQYWGGHGATPAEAEDNAISHVGGGRWLAYVCTTRN
ncbi:DUF4189 domain-containing protein [Streptomyces sp. NBC_01431]|uniref:DUF4189 domain-containing protein n=1 Tax=Streptomyces sp. NBC_01431 TaxID=2903863 RepID=UPI002E379F94|nr:DUF4189 domain-containing protein [Streptomyces sp. NBC_01431]